MPGRATVPVARGLDSPVAVLQLLTSKGGGPPGSEAPPFCSAPRGFASLRAPAAFRSCMAETMFVSKSKLACTTLNPAAQHAAGY